ncbi:hypothetical protein UY3_17645 [Chelonia mydas]|uniref:Uncharacterized protein n=1 Tax=Chelonia mydas TaxID=8469 RepID=M7AR33_CHEMY|nr:hypothetical protein UY3_17645 [Chelonia mydas]
MQESCANSQQFLATRVVFCKDGEEILSQKSLLRKLTYGYDLVVSKGSSGNYSYASVNWLGSSRPSPSTHLSAGTADSSGTQNGEQGQSVQCVQKWLELGFKDGASGD